VVCGWEDGSVSKPVCFSDGDKLHPINERAVAQIADALRDEIRAAPANSTIMLRVILDPQGLVSTASKISLERFPLRDSE